MNCILKAVKKLKDITEYRLPSGKNTVVALGIFDGVHLGHRAVIKKVMEYSSENLLPAVFTFNSDTMEKKHNSPFRYIYTNAQKLSLLESMGISYICCPDFKTLRNMDADEFAGRVLAETMCAGKVVCGRRFHFGKGASCGVRELRELGIKYGFEVFAIPPVLDDSISVSSSLIRSLISDGNIQKANVLLGKNYEIESKVIYGRQLGRTIGIPTANQKFGERQLVPFYGVYASRTVVNGKEYPSITDVGVKPTVEENSLPLAETHIIGFKGDIYGKNIKVILDDMIREEQKFNSLSELKSAIEKDIKTAVFINSR